MFVDAYQNYSVLTKQTPRQFQAGIHHVEPISVESARGLRIGGEFASSFVHLACELQIIFYVVLEVVGINEIIAGVVRRVNVDELYLSSIAFLEQLEDFEVVALDQEILCSLPLHAVLWRREQRTSGWRESKLASAALAVPVQAVLLL